MIFKERGILYSTAMVQAKLAGTKTQTRRIVKPQPSKQWAIAKWCKEGPGSIDASDMTAADMELDELLESCKYGQVGDILYGRETFYASHTIDGSDKVPGSEAYLYFADQQNKRSYGLSDEGYKNIFGSDKKNWPKWKPSLFMPTEAARIWDRITGIRIERLQDITEADAIAEGIEPLISQYQIHEESGYRRELDLKPMPWLNYLWRTSHDDGSQYSSCDSPIDSYRTLWQSINGKPSPILGKDKKPIGYIVYPWGEDEAAQFGDTYRGLSLQVIPNPWVWVIETESLSVTGRPDNI